jgi:hypothetical protein
VNVYASSDCPSAFLPECCNVDLKNGQHLYGNGSTLWKGIKNSDFEQSKSPFQALVGQLTLDKLDRFLGRAIEMLNDP